MQLATHPAVLTSWPTATSKSASTRIAKFRDLRLYLDGCVHLSMTLYFKNPKILQREGRLTAEKERLQICLTRLKESAMYGWILIWIQHPRLAAAGGAYVAGVR